MARWLVKLQGERVDLDELLRWFPEGENEVFALKKEEIVYLAGPVFEGFVEADQVWEKALQIIDELSGVISLLWPNHRRPGVAGIFRETNDGQCNEVVFLRSGSTARSRASGTLEGEASRTQGRELLLGAYANNHLRTALTLWADPIRTWPILYRILEEIEGYLGKRVRVNHVGFCSEDERKRFAHSANAAETAGEHARHALGRYEPPKKPMSLPEAREFISSMLKKALMRAAHTRPAQDG